MAALPFHDIKYSDVAQQGRGDRDTYARRYGYPGWQEMEAAGGASLALGGGGSSGSIDASIAETARKREELGEKLRGEEQEFLGRFRTEFPQILTGLEEQLDLPGLREQAFKTTELVRTTPERQKQATRGFDVSANQLERMIAAEVGELSPISQTAIQQAQFGEEEFGRQAQRALVPFETEIGLMKDRFAREYSGFNQDSENALNALISKFQMEGQLSIAEMTQATQLAQLEESKRQFEQGISSIDLGNRVILIDSRGNQVGTFDKGKLTTLGAGQNEWSFV